MFNFEPTRFRNSVSHPELDLWVLRLLVLLNARKEYIQDSQFRSPYIADLIGLDKSWLVSAEQTGHRCLETELRRLLALRESLIPDGTYSPFFPNTRKLVSLLALSEVECRLLEFTIVLKTDHVLCDMSDVVGDLSGGQTVHVLSVILDIHPKEIREALKLDSTLSRSGMLSMRRRSTSILASKLELLTDSLPELIQDGVEDPLLLLRGAILPCSAPTLRIDDFAQVGEEVSLIHRLLARVLSKPRRGT